MSSFRPFFCPYDYTHKGVTKKIMDLKTLITLLITIGGWCMSLGIYVSKIKQHDKDISELKKDQKSLEVLLQSINNNLTELNTKVGFLLEERNNVK